LSHWIDEMDDIIPELSVRARNVLRNSVPFRTSFLDMDRESILKLRNCGVKTADELVHLRDRLCKKSLPQKELFDDFSHKNDSTKISVKLTRPAVKLLKEHGWSTADPMAWNMDTLLEEVHSKSRPLEMLSEYKVQYWCKQNNAERKTPEELEDVYLKYRELPFCATLCGVSITEARKRLRRYISNVKKFKKTRLKSIYDEINFLLPENDRNRYICIRRSLPWGDTLEALGDEMGLTRERVRQIEEKSRTQVAARSMVAAHRLTFLTRISQKIVEIGDDLSFSVLKSILYNEDGNLNKIVATLSLIGSIQQYPDQLTPIIETSRLIEELPEQSELTIRQKSIADSLSLEIIRKLRRTSRNAGAIHVETAMEIMKVNTIDVGPILKQLCFEEIENNWFLYTIDSTDKHNPIANSAGKILKVSGPTHLDDIWQGCVKHAKRLKHIVAPVSIIRKVLSEAGFFIENDNIVSPNGINYDLSGAEKKFIEAIEHFGGCASFWELYTYLVEGKNLSLPSLSTFLLRTSPIVAIVEQKARFNLYGIRGREVDEESIVEAVARQPNVEKEISHSFTLNGIVIETSTTTWLITSGVLSLPSHIHLPQGSWRWECCGITGKAQITDTFLYGLSTAINTLNLKLKDRVRFNFNTLHKKIEIEFVEREANE
jgi:hypothetical protein